MPVQLIQSEFLDITWWEILGYLILIGVFILVERGSLRPHKGEKQ